MLQNFNIIQIERVLIIKSWLGRQGLQLLETLMQEEQEECYDEEGLFKILNKKFRSQYSETRKSLQLYNVARHHDKSLEEWMGRPRTEAVECNFGEVDRQLKEQFIHGVNDSDKPTETIRGPTKSNENMMIPSEHVLVWVKRIKAQGPQAAVISSLHEVKNFVAILQKDDCKQRGTKPGTPVKMPARRRYNYGSQVCKPRYYLVYGKKCENCNKMNHFKEALRVMQSTIWRQKLTRNKKLTLQQLI